MSDLFSLSSDGQVSRPPKTDWLTIMTRKVSVIFLFWSMCLCGLQITALGEEPSDLRVMTWNIWGKLNQEPRYTLDDLTARTRTIEILKDSGADLIAMIETYGSAADIAKALNFHHYTPHASANLSIFSRYPLSEVGTPDGLSSFSFIRATAQVSDTQSIKVHCIWLTSGGRHLVEIQNESVSDQAFIDGDANRAEMLGNFFSHSEIQDDLKNIDQLPLIIAGDFNCVSHLDYNEPTRDLNFGRVFQTSPVHRQMLDHGFVDSYREVHPELTAETLGYTWTTVGLDFKYESNMGFVPADPRTHPNPEYRIPYGRIDFIYSGGGLRPVESRVIRHFKQRRARSFPEFPSDHAAVYSRYRLTSDDKSVPPR